MRNYNIRIIYYIEFEIIFNTKYIYTSKITVPQSVMIVI